MRALTSAGGGEIVRHFPLVPGLCLVTLPAGAKVEQALTPYNHAADVLYAEPDYVVHAIQTTPNDPEFTALWGLQNTGQTGGTPGADINAGEAWDMHVGSHTPIVAVIDTGGGLQSYRFGSEHVDESGRDPRQWHR